MAESKWSFPGINAYRLRSRLSTNVRGALHKASMPAGRERIAGYNRAMWKNVLSSGRVQSLLAIIIWAYMFLIWRTLRWRVEGEEQLSQHWGGGKGLVMAAWHSRILLLPTMKLAVVPRLRPLPAPIGIMISQSRDGEFVAKACGYLGLNPVRGSGANAKKKDRGKGAVAATRASVDICARGGVVCITVDGPRGPREVVNPGVVAIARLSGAGIAPLALATAPAKRLRSWDRFILPGLLWGRGAIVIGEPVFVNRADDPEAVRQSVERALQQAHARAESLVRPLHAKAEDGASDLPARSAERQQH